MHSIPATVLIDFVPISAPSRTCQRHHRKTQHHSSKKERHVHNQLSTCLSIEVLFAKVYSETTTSVHSTDLRWNSAEIKTSKAQISQKEGLIHRCIIYSEHRTGQFWVSRRSTLNARCRGPFSAVVCQCVRFSKNLMRFFGGPRFAVVKKKGKRERKKAGCIGWKLDSGGFTRCWWWAMRFEKCISPRSEDQNEELKNMNMCLNVLGCDALKVSWFERRFYVFMFVSLFTSHSASFFLAMCRGQWSFFLLLKQFGCLFWWGLVSSLGTGISD